MLFSDAVFNIFAGVFDVLNDVRQNVAVVLLFLCSIIPTSMLLFVSVCCYPKPRCYYSCLYAVMRNLDAIIRACMLLFETSMLLFLIRVRMLLCETSMLLFVFRIMFCDQMPAISPQHNNGVPSNAYALIEYRNNKTTATFWRTSLRTSKTPAKI